MCVCVCVCLCARVCVWGVVMEIRLSKNLAHQMDKQLIGFILFFSIFNCNTPIAQPN